MTTSVLIDQIKNNIIEQDSLLLHCYIISNKGMKIIIPILENILYKDTSLLDHLDHVLVRYTKDRYTLKKSICIQKKSKSNNNWPLNADIITDTELWPIIQKSPSLQLPIGCLIKHLYKPLKT